MAGLFGDVGSLIGGIAALGETKRGYKKAIDQFGNVVDVPTTFETPEQSFSQDAQRRAIEQLAGVGGQRGMDEAARAQVQDVLARTAAQERGAREAAIQKMAAQGTLGGGQQLASALAGSQTAAQAAAAGSAEAVGAGRIRALNALASGGSLAGTSREQTQARERALQAAREFNARQRLAKAGGLADLYTGKAKAVGDQYVGLGKAGGDVAGGVAGLLMPTGSTGGY